MTTDVAPQPEAEPAPQAPYAVSLDVIRPESSSRILNFPLFIGMIIRSVLVIPHIIALYFLGAVAMLLYLVATVAIVFTGRYPRALHSFVTGNQRWSNNVSVYLLGLVDKYPPFSMDPQEAYPVVFTADYPEQSSRILNFPLLGVFIKYFLLIPNVIVLYLLLVVAVLIMIVAPFAILFSGVYPEGMHRFVTGVARWSARVQAYVFGLTDRYPPFSTK